MNSKISTEFFKQSNSITEAKYEYSLIEKRLIYLAIMEAGKIETVDIYSNLKVFIPETTLKKFDTSDNYYRNYRKAIISLRKKDFSIDFEDGSWIETGFISSGKYVRNSGIEIDISEYLVPHLWSLSRRFTLLDATVVMILQSKYSQRLYEFCAKWRSVGHFSFTPDTMRAMLMLKWSNSEIKRDVIEIAQAELMQMFNEGIADLYFTYTEERGGRGRGGSVKKWNFKIHTKKQEKEKEKAKNVDLMVVFNFLGELFNNTSIVDKAIESIGNHENMKDFANRIEKLTSSQRWSQITNKTGYIRSILQNEYGMDEKEG